MLLKKVNHRHTPDSRGKPAGCAAPEDLERIAGLGPKKRPPRLVSAKPRRDTPPPEASALSLRSSRRGDMSRPKIDLQKMVKLNQSCSSIWSECQFATVSFYSIRANVNSPLHSESHFIFHLFLPKYLIHGIALNSLIFESLSYQERF